jgi:CheY-like chemotaxis protein
MAAILIAGADQAALETLAAEVAGEGHTVLTAQDGQTAYDVALAAQPDILFLEPNLPVLTGYETCSLIRGDPSFRPGLPVFILAGEDYDPVALRKCGVTGQFPKEHLVQELRDLLVKQLGAAAVPK